MQACIRAEVVNRRPATSDSRARTCHQRRRRYMSKFHQWALRSLYYERQIGQILEFGLRAFLGGTRTIHASCDFLPEV